MQGKGSEAPPASDLVEEGKSAAAPPKIKAPPPNLTRSQNKQASPIPEEVSSAPETAPVVELPVGGDGGKAVSNTANKGNEQQSREPVASSGGEQKTVFGYREEELDPEAYSWDAATGFRDIETILNGSCERPRMTGCPHLSCLRSRLERAGVHHSHAIMSSVSESVLIRCQLP